MKPINSTLAQFLEYQVSQDNRFDKTIIELILNVAKACTAIHHILRDGDVGDTLGDVVDTNIHDEEQKKLDILSNSLIIEHCSKCDSLSALASEEMEDPVSISPKSGKHLLLFDPLDGSSNININGPVGTIASILPASENNDFKEDFLQPGKSQLAALYVLYGPATALVITMGAGVFKFALSPKSGDFILVGENIRIPADTSEFSINVSNYRFWEQPVRRYIDECLQGKDSIRNKDFNMRWVAAMVCDVHRVLSRGGTFLYPIDEKIRKREGRLRLMYEANPMAFIVEQAGGIATTGYKRILDVRPATLHQRIPVILGSKNEVELIRSYHSYQS